MSIGLTLLLVLLPFLLVAAVAIVAARRTQKHYLADDSPFAAKPYPAQPTPLAWLPGLSIAERLYLAERLKFGGIFPLVLLYVFAMAGIIPVFNNSPSAHLWTNPGVLAWLNFMRMPTNLMASMNVVWIITAFLAVQPLRTGPFAMEPWRVRPVSLRFLFWASMLPVFLGELLAVAAGMLLALACFYKVHGPVWQHLPPTIPRILGPDDSDIAQLYANLLHSSFPHTVFSLLTTAALTIAVASVLFLAPVRAFGSPRMLFVVFLIPVAASVPLAKISFLNPETSTGPGPIARFFFLDYALGTPPPYAFALVPIALTVGLLLLANHLAHRTDA